MAGIDLLEAGGYDDAPDPTGEHTARLWLDLPEVYRHADQAGDYPLLRWLDGLLSQGDAVLTLAERFRYTPTDELDEAEPTATSDLVDPATADGGWLLWLAQLVGVAYKITGGTTAADRRALITNAADTWDHSTPSDLAEAAAVGTISGDPADVEVTPHYGGDPFVIGIGADAGNVNTLNTWAELKAAAPTWRNLEQLGTFANTLAPGPAREAIAAQAKPAGYRLVGYTT